MIRLENVVKAHVTQFYTGSEFVSSQNPDTG